MISELWKSFKSADSGKAIVQRASGPVSAGALRAAASGICEGLKAAQGSVFLYSDDAANFLTGLVGALMAGRDVLLPGHCAPAYLRELGADGSVIISDVMDLNPAIIPCVKNSISASQVCDIQGDLNGRIGFFTSGSSAQPKLCMKSLQQLAAEVHMLRQLWDGPIAPVVGTVSQQHIYGFLFRILWPLASGRPIVSERQDNWESVAFHLAQGSLLITSPSHLSRIPKDFMLPHQPRAIFCSGAALSSEAARDATSTLGQCPIEVLGSTETGGIAWRIQDKDGAVWTKLPDVEIIAGSENTLTMRSPTRDIPDFISTGDQISAISQGTFILLARLDRVVKIEGKRVSLPRVEEAIAALPDISDVSAIDLPERNGALGAIVVLNADGERKLQSEGNFRFSRLLRRALAERLEPMELPRFWRFVASVPQNVQGKRIAGDLRLLFMQHSPEVPIILSRQIEEHEARFDLELMPELRWFEGHFPGQPIFPGVAQIHIARLLAEEVWGVPFLRPNMARIKFRQIMRPGERVTLTLRRSNPSRLDFRFLRDGEVVASGTLDEGT